MKNKTLFYVVLFTLCLSACKKELFINEPGNLVPITADLDPEIPSIQVNGTILHAETFGNPNDPILLILHGGPGADYRYLLNCAAFANDGYFVVFFDQRGSGLSQRHDKDVYSMDQELADVTAVIDYYKLTPDQKVFFLGHSWGAMLATAYINAYPTAISGAIIAEPGGFTFDDMMGYVERSRSIVLTSELMNDFLYADQFITGNEDQHAILDYRYALLATADADEDSPTGNVGSLPFWRSGAVVNSALFEFADKFGFDWTTNLQAFTTKILFVYSENNIAYGETYAQHVASAYPAVQFLEIFDEGHDMISYPNGFNTFYPVALDYLNNLK